MEIDAIMSPTLANLLDEMNKLKVCKDNIVSIFQNSEKIYIAIFYI